MNVLPNLYKIHMSWWSSYEF